MNCFNKQSNVDLESGVYPKIKSREQKVSCSLNHSELRWLNFKITWFEKSINETDFQSSDFNKERGGIVHERNFWLKSRKNIQSHGKTGEEQAKRLKYLNKRASTTGFDVDLAHSSVLWGEMWIIRTWN